MVVSIVRIRPTRGAATYATTTIVSTRRRTPRTKRTVAATPRAVILPRRFFRCPWESDDEGLPPLATSGFLDEGVERVLREPTDMEWCSLLDPHILSKEGM